MPLNLLSGITPQWDAGAQYHLSLSFYNISIVLQLQNISWQYYLFICLSVCLLLMKRFNISSATMSGGNFDTVLRKNTLSCECLYLWTPKQLGFQSWVSQLQSLGSGCWGWWIESHGVRVKVVKVQATDPATKSPLDVSPWVISRMLCYKGLRQWTSLTWLRNQLTVPSESLHCSTV